MLWWAAALIVAIMFAVSLGFLAGVVWHSSVGHWPDEQT
jgi:hypothetical protein